MILLLGGMHFLIVYNWYVFISRWERLQNSGMDVQNWWSILLLLSPWKSNLSKGDMDLHWERVQQLYPNNSVDWNIASVKMNDANKSRLVQQVSKQLCAWSRPRRNQRDTRQERTNEWHHQQLQLRCLRCTTSVVRKCSSFFLWSNCLIVPGQVEIHS